MTDKKITQYPGNEVDVTWNGRLCIHIGECGRAKGDLFVGGRQPWCLPDLASQEEVNDVVTSCPTGALVFEAQDGSSKEQVENENTVVVSYNGPFFVRGDLDIEGVDDDMPGTRYRAALCRCGESNNKPFCDNAHEKIGFQDYGAVGEKGDGLSAHGGKLSIKALPDGPLLLSGNLSIKASSGRVAWQGTQVALCRCGASKNKPFCDGSHKEAGFKSD